MSQVNTHGSKLDFHIDNTLKESFNGYVDVSNNKNSNKINTKLTGKDTKIKTKGNKLKKENLKQFILKYVWGTNKAPTYCS